MPENELLYQMGLEFGRGLVAALTSAGIGNAACGGGCEEKKPKEEKKVGRPKKDPKEAFWKFVEGLEEMAEKSGSGEEREFLRRMRDIIMKWSQEGINYKQLQEWAGGKVEAWQEINVSRVVALFAAKENGISRQDLIDELKCESKDWGGEQFRKIKSLIEAKKKKANAGSDSF